MPSRPVVSRLTGPATRGTARAAGITDKQLRHRDVVRLSRDTYLPRAMARDLPARIAAVLMTAPASAVVSDVTAAALWDLAIPLQKRESRIHLTVAPGAVVRSRADRFIHRSARGPDVLTTRLDLLLTTPERHGGTRPQCWLRRHCSP